MPSAPGLVSVVGWVVGILVSYFGTRVVRVKVCRRSFRCVIGFLRSWRDIAKSGRLAACPLRAVSSDLRGRGWAQLRAWPAT